MISTPWSPTPQLAQLPAVQLSILNNVSAYVRPGGVPNAEGKYAIVTVQGQVDTSTFVNETTWTQFLGKLSGAEYRIDLFEVKTAAKDFGEMGVFEYNSGATDKGVSDTELVYNGQAINVGVTDGGKILKCMELLRIYLIDNNIIHTFWCLNPNSGDTGGLLGYAAIFRALSREPAK